LGFFFLKKLGVRDSDDLSDKSFEDNEILSRMVMGLGVKVSASMSLFVINLVGKGTIREVRDENMKKGEEFFLLHFHSELDTRGNVI
jgi:hypothetical protein